MNIFSTHSGSVVRKTLNILLFVTALFSVAVTSAQTPPTDPAIKATQVYGKVSEINAAAGQITIKTDAGSVVMAGVSEKTTYQRMPPGETDRAKAVETALTEIAVGDGVVARGFVAADRKSVPAQQIIVVSQSEIAKKHTAERMAWGRGAKGIVSAINPTAKEITVTSRSMAGTPQAVIVALNDKAKIRRFPPDSIPRYENAKTAKFEEVKVGDQFNAKGEKSTDGTHLTAEEVLFGTFKIAGGTVTAVDVANGQIKLTDLQTKKPLTIIVRPDSVIRRLPANAAMMLGGGGGPGGPGGGGQGAQTAQGQGQTQGQAQTAQGGGQGPRPQGAGPGGPSGPGGPRPGGSMADLMERFPTISLSELKIGDTVLLSSLPGSDPTQLTAIQVVSGVEPLLAMMAARQQQGGQSRSQNVDLQGSFGGMFGGAGVP
jgi:hypothetical protein